MRQVVHPAAHGAHVSGLAAPRRPGGQAAHALRTIHSTEGVPFRGRYWAAPVVAESPPHTGKVGHGPGITRCPFSAAALALGPRVLLQVPGSRENAGASVVASTLPEDRWWGH